MNCIFCRDDRFAQRGLNMCLFHGNGQEADQFARFVFGEGEVVREEQKIS